MFDLLRDEASTMNRENPFKQGLSQILIAFGATFVLHACPASGQALLPLHTSGVAAEQSLIRTYETSWITTGDPEKIQERGLNFIRFELTVLTARV